jgi:hypothetical protein
VFDALVSYKLMGRKPLYITAGREVTDPLTGAGFSVTRSHSFLIISFTLHHSYRGYKTRADLDICVPGHKALKAESIKLSHSKREGTLITGSAAVLFVLYTASRFVTTSLQFHLDPTRLFNVTTYRTHVKLSSRIEGYSPSL